MIDYKTLSDFAANGGKIVLTPRYLRGKLRLGVCVGYDDLKFVDHIDLEDMDIPKEFEKLLTDEMGKIVRCLEKNFKQEKKNEV